MVQLVLFVFTGHIQRNSGPTMIEMATLIASPVCVICIAVTLYVILQHKCRKMPMYLPTDIQDPSFPRNHDCSPSDLVDLLNKEGTGSGSGKIPFDLFNYIDLFFFTTALLVLISFTSQNFNGIHMCSLFQESFQVSHMWPKPTGIISMKWLALQKWVMSKMINEKFKIVVMLYQDQI